MIDKPRRFRVKLKPARKSKRVEYRYGCYFPETKMAVDEFGERSQGGPPKGVQWIDR